MSVTRQCRSTWLLIIHVLAPQGCAVCTLCNGNRQLATRCPRWRRTRSPLGHSALKQYRAVLCGIVRTMALSPGTLREGEVSMHPFWTHVATATTKLLHQLLTRKAQAQAQSLLASACNTSRHEWKALLSWHGRGHVAALPEQHTTRSQLMWFVVMLYGLHRQAKPDCSTQLGMQEKGGRSATTRMALLNLQGM